MPYISKVDREFIDAIVNSDLLSGCTCGELNYAITTILISYYEKNGPSYQCINDIVGILECVKQEFYRRVAVPYEETKKMQNGDVF